MVYRAATIVMILAGSGLVSTSSVIADQDYCPAGYTFVGFHEEPQKNTVVRHPLCKNLVDLIEDTTWPTKAKATYLLGVLMAGRSNYTRAISYFQIALQAAPNDPRITSTLDTIRSLQAEQAVQAGLGPISKGLMDAALLGSLSKVVRDRVLIAMSLVDVGDFASALILLNEAREFNSAHMELKEAEIYVSQLLAQKSERQSNLSSEEKAQRVAIARANGRRDAAWSLGLHLSNHADNDTALAYYKEAKAGFPPDSFYYRLLDHMITHPEDYGPTQETPIYDSKATAILDALQYGDGDWEKSVEYLQVAYKIEPENMFVLDALIYVEKMSDDDEPLEE